MLNETDFTSSFRPGYSEQFLNSKQTIRVEFKAKLSSNTAPNNPYLIQFTNTKSHIHESNTLIF